MRRVHAQDAVFLEMLETLGNAFPGEQVEEDLLAVFSGTRFENHEVVEAARSVVAQLLAWETVDHVDRHAASAGIREKMEEALFLAFVQLDDLLGRLVEVEVLEGSGIGSRGSGVQANNGDG